MNACASSSAMHIVPYSFSNLEKFCCYRGNINFVSAEGAVRVLAFDSGKDHSGNSLTVRGTAPLREEGLLSHGVLIMLIWFLIGVGVKVYKY